MEAAQLGQVLSDLDRWQVLAVLVKALTYGACFAATGGVIFIVLFSSYLSERQREAQWRFVALAALAAMLLSVVRIGLMSATMAGEASGLLDRAMIGMVLQSSEGTSTALRVGGLLLIVVVAGRCANGLRSSLATVVALFGAVLGVASFFLVGHSGEVQGKAGLAPALLCIHLLAVAFWLGALWPLHQSTYDGDYPGVATVMERFGKIAAFVVALLIADGLVLLGLILGNASALWTSAYGQLVLVKLFWVALLLGLAAFNKLRLTPLLLEGDRSALVRLRRSIKTEIAIATLILVVTAAFTTLVGPAESS